jgi:hypothetical protein
MADCDRFHCRTRDGVILGLFEQVRRRLNNLLSHLRPLEETIANPQLFGHDFLFFVSVSRSDRRSRHQFGRANSATSFAGGLSDRDNRNYRRIMADVAAGRASGCPPGSFVDGPSAESIRAAFAKSSRHNGLIGNPAALPESGEVCHDNPAEGRRLSSPSSSRAEMVVRTIKRDCVPGNGRPRCIEARLSHMTTSPGRQRWR